MGHSRLPSPRRPRAGDGHGGARRRAFGAVVLVDDGGPAPAPVRRPRGAHASRVHLTGYGVSPESGGYGVSPENGGYGVSPESGGYGVSLEGRDEAARLVADHLTGP